MIFNSLISSGILLSAANILSGALGYGYQIVMGRMLQPSGYALFSSIIALTVFFGAPLGALVMLISRKVSYLRAHNQYEDIYFQYIKITKQLLLFGFIALLLLYPISIFVASLWNEVTVSMMYIFGLIVVISAFVMINNAFLQGLQLFPWFAAQGVVAVIIKITLSVVFVLLGLAVNGALLGVLVPSFLIWWAGSRNIRSVLTVNKGGASSGNTEKFLILRSYAPILVANISLVAMTQLDIVLVNMYFPSVVAGQYAAASVLGKVILYLPGGLALALFPKVAEDHATNNSSFKFLVKTLIATTVLCMLAALFYGIFGTQIVTLFYGESYYEAGKVLQWYGFAIYPLTIVMVVENFLIAKGRMIFAWLFLIAAPLQMLTIGFWHEDLMNVLVVMAASGLLLLFTGVILIRKDLFQALKGCLKES